MIINVLMAVIVIYCSYKMFNNTAGTLSLGKINIISFIYYLCLLQCLCGAILVSLGYDEHYMLDKLIFPTESVKSATFAVYFMMLALPFFIYVIFKIFKFDAQREYSGFLNREIEEKSNNIVFICITIIVVIQIIALIVLLYKIGYIPIIKMFFHDSNFSLSVERQINDQIQVLGIPYIKSIVILFGIPIISYITVAYALANRELKWIILAIICFGMALITKTYDFSKSPLVFHLFVYLLIFIYYKGGIKNKIVLLFGGAMLGILLAFYRIFGYAGSFFDIYNGILGRTLFTQFGTLCCHFDMFPDIFGYLEGKSLYPTVLKFIGQDPDSHIRSAQLVMDFYGSDRVYEGTAGVMNAAFIGEAYANWGWIGVFGSIVWVGVIVALLFIVIMKSKKTPATLAFLAVMTQMIGSMTQGGFVEFVYSSSILLTVIGFIIIIYLKEIIKKVAYFIHRLSFKKN